MNRSGGIITGIILAASSAFVFFFLGFPFLSQQQDQTSQFITQNPDSVSTLASDIDSCVSSPSSDCDQEMLQISNYCKQNHGQNLPFCSDPRISMYINNRGLSQPTVNGGSNPQNFVLCRVKVKLPDIIKLFDKMYSLVLSSFRIVVNLGVIRIIVPTYFSNGPPTST